MQPVRSIRFVTAIAVAAPVIWSVDSAARWRDPQLEITTDRLSYRLERFDEYYRRKLVVRLANTSRDTVFLTTACGMPGKVPYREFASLDGAALFIPVTYGCALSGSASGPAGSTIAIPPDSAIRDTAIFAARPFVHMGEAGPREGVARFEIRYTPLVRRGFLRRTWTVDGKVWLSSDPFELVTPGSQQ